MTFSVMVPSWQYGMFLAEAVDSLLACDAPGFDEILIVDDCSTDNTSEVAARYATRGVHYVRNESRKGIVWNLNTYLTAFISEWVCMVSADDWVEPAFARAHAEVIEQHTENPAFAIAYSGATYRVTHRPTERPELDGRVIGLDRWDAQALVHANFIHGSAVIRRSVIAQVGGFPDVRPEDWAMWKRMAAAGFFGVPVGVPLLNYRLHSYGHRDSGTDGKRAQPGWKP